MLVVVAVPSPTQRRWLSLSSWWRRRRWVRRCVFAFVASADGREFRLAQVPDNPIYDQLDLYGRDWAISRNRYWGTPLPIWRNEDTGETVCIGSREELEKKPSLFISVSMAIAFDDCRDDAKYYAYILGHRFCHIVGSFKEGGELRQAHPPPGDIGNRIGCG